jgi:hypothetical protein
MAYGDDMKRTGDQPLESFIDGRGRKLHAEVQGVEQERVKGSA